MRRFAAAVALAVGLGVVLLRVSRSEHAQDHAGSALPFALGGDVVERERFAWTGRFNADTRRTEARLLVDGHTVEIDHRIARSCLGEAKTSIAFIGDSLMRFQYVNLAYFLTTGYWESHPSLPSNEKVESFKGGWTEFFRVTNARLTTKETTEICDCDRRADFWTKDTIENHFWTSVDGTMLSYAGLFHYLKGIGFHSMEWLSPCFAPGRVPCAQTGCHVGYCLLKNATHMQLSGNEAIVHVANLVKANVLVLNQGAWLLSGMSRLDFTVMTSQSLEALNFVTKSFSSLSPQTKLWLKTTLPVLHKNDELAFSDFFDREIKLYSQIKSADTFNPRTAIQLLLDEVTAGKHDAWVPVANRSEAVMYDKVHVHPYVNRAVNELFLLKLIGKTCPQAFSRGRGKWAPPSEPATEFAPY